MKIFAFAGSLRKDSFNKKLIRYVADVVRANGHDVDLAEFNEFDMPLYNFDVQQSQGIPKGAQALAARITAAEAMVVAKPECNYGIPGTLRNAIDWLSRMTPQPLRGRFAYLCAASGSPVGGHRGLWAMRAPIEGLGCMVYPDHFGLSGAPNAFDEQGKIKDATQAGLLDTQLKGFLKYAALLRTGN
jgi:NAD(P)H-dependent FMN reductase